MHIKMAEDLQELSVSETCLVFGPAYSNVVLRARPGYMLKVPTTLFRDQLMSRQIKPDPCYVQCMLCAFFLDWTEHFIRLGAALCLFWGTVEGQRLSSNRGLWMPFFWHTKHTVCVTPGIASTFH